VEDRGPVALWLVGRWLIRFALRLLERALARQKFDPTLARYLDTGIGVVLNIALAIAILGFFGVETTTFAALLAAGGVAIGVAWGGLLSNFAAGAFLVFLRPFKVGDFVSAGGVVGTVDSIGLVGTTINADYWQVYFDTNRMIREAFGGAGFPAPLPMYGVSGVGVPIEQ
jgi:small conductance mechanosensitive channel